MVKRRRSGGPKARKNRRKGAAGAGAGGPAPVSNGAQEKVPRSFILHSGNISSSVSTLLHDLRDIFEPYTASALKQTKSNRMKDFVNMSGTLGVSHMLVLNQPGMQRKNKTKVAGPSSEKKKKDDGDLSAANDSGRVNLRICNLPRGPTLTFRVNKYSLRKDVLNAHRRPPTKGNEFLTPPLLVLNNFGSGQQGGGNTRGKEVQLMISLFQNLFPPIHVQTMHLSSARRIVLLHYNPATKTIDLRHYVINVRPIGVSKRLRRVVEGSSSSGKSAALRAVAAAAANGESGGAGAAAANKKGAMPDLGRVNDISDYVLGRRRMDVEGGNGDDDDAASIGVASGFETDASSDAESDGEEGDKATVDLFQDYVGKGNIAGKRRGTEGGNQRAVRLREIGPRLEMRLIKIEDGIAGGDVLYHDYVKKSATEQAATKRSIAEATALRAERRAEQERNVERKQAEIEARKTKGGRRGARTEGGSDAEGEEGSDEADQQDGEAEEEEDDDEFEYEDKFADQAQDDGQDDAGFDEDEELFEDVSSDEEEEKEGEGSDDSGEIENESDGDFSPIEITSDFEEIASGDELEQPRPHSRGGQKASKRAKR